MKIVQRDCLLGDSLCSFSAIRSYAEQHGPTFYEKLRQNIDNLTAA